MSAKPTDEVAPKHILICSVKQFDKPKFEKNYPKQKIPLRKGLLVTPRNVL